MVFHKIDPQQPDTVNVWQVLQLCINPLLKWISPGSPLSQLFCLCAITSIQGIECYYTASCRCIVGNDFTLKMADIDYLKIIDDNQEITCPLHKLYIGYTHEWSNWCHQFWWLHKTISNKHRYII